MKNIPQEIKEAIEKLGYKNLTVDVIRTLDGRHWKVFVNKNKYFGTWDSDRKTFVD